MRFAAVAIVAALIGGFAIYDNYDKKTNYQPVDARVSAVSDQCFMEKVEKGVLTKTTSTSDLLPCDVAEVLTRQHPNWQGFAIKHKIEIKFAYVSPVDGATHFSTLQMSDFPKGQPLRMGDVLRVLASKSKPDKTRQA
jgi:hypothetical protein